MLVGYVAIVADGAEKQISAIAGILRLDTALIARISRSAKNGKCVAFLGDARDLLIALLDSFLLDSNLLGEFFHTNVTHDLFCLHNYNSFLFFILKL